MPWALAIASACIVTLTGRATVSPSRWSADQFEHRQQRLGVG